MEIIQNTISRDWIVRHKGVRYFVNYTHSDGQTPALRNRYNWEIFEETKNGKREVEVDVPQEPTPQQYRKAKQDYLLWHKLLVFCVENWNNEFLEGLKEGVDHHASVLKH